MTQQPDYQPGDIANGHRLGEDGQWHPLDDATTAAPAPAPKGGFLGWMGRHKILTGVGALFLLLVLVGALASGGGDDTTRAAVAASSSATPTTQPTEPASETPTSTPTPTGTTRTPTPTPTPKETSPTVTRAQENALRAAQDYLAFKGFSRKGLIDQLTSEYGDGFDKEDATWAVDHLDVDWNEQAVRVAEDYLDFKGFSRQGLIDQLSSEYGEQFTVKQATYAADQVGL